MSNTPLSMLKVWYSLVHRNLVGRSEGLYRFSRVGPIVNYMTDIVDDKMQFSRRFISINCSVQIGDWLSRATILEFFLCGWKAE
jgi:hypothetical protein